MKLLLCGDVCPTELSAPLFAQKQTDTLFTDVKALFDQSDFAFVNLECALTESDHAITKFGPNLKAPGNTAHVLKELGVTCCGLSNNHIFDFGIPGVQDTLAALEEAGLDHTGFGDNEASARKNYIIPGTDICLIAVCEHEYSYALEDRMGARAYDPYDTMADIRQARQDGYRVIVIYHGGKELCLYPSPRVRKLCRAMVDNGAEVILGQHSHCIATYECYKGGHILHGQGNFHFTKEHKFAGWNSCLAVTYDTDTRQMTFTPIVAEGPSLSIAKGQTARDLLDAFEARNRELENGQWLRGWHAFCEENRELYTRCVANACVPDAPERKNHFFAHYLDCEAHTDVWRELFPTYNHTNER